MKKTIDRLFDIKAGSLQSDGAFGTFKGHGSVFGELDSYRDIVMPGAFSKSLAAFAAKERPVPMLWQHDSRQPIGVYTTIKEDDIGLYVEGQINLKVAKGQEAYALMEQKALSGLSIGYNTVRDEWDEKAMTRKLFEVDLWEVSPVTFPAGDQARIASVKSIEDLANLSDCESLLRDAGFSKSEATLFTSRIKAIAMRSESADGSAEFKSVLDTLKSLR